MQTSSATCCGIPFLGMGQIKLSPFTRPIKSSSQSLNGSFLEIPQGLGPVYYYILTLVHLQKETLHENKRTPQHCMRRKSTEHTLCPIHINKVWWELLRRCTPGALLMRWSLNKTPNALSVTMKSRWKRPTSWLQ